VIHFFALTLAVVAPAVAASPVPGPVATPLPLASPGIIATPNSTAGLILPAVPAVAPTFLERKPQEPSGELVGTSGPFVGLSLDDAVAMALARNTDLAVSQSNVRIARFQIVAAQGAYDLRFAIAPSFGFQQTPSISVFEAGPDGNPLQNVQLGNSAALTALTPSGANLSLMTSLSRTNNNSTVNSFNPYYQTGIAFNVTQPLARGRAIDANRRQLQLSAIGAGINSANALLTASGTIASVLDAYYDLVAAWRNVGIQEDALLQAKAQSESNARLVRQGAAAPVDVVESNTQVEVFQDNVYSAIQDVARLQNQLKQLTLSDPADPIWTVNIVPTSPVTDLPPEPSLNELMLDALKTRPEVAALRGQMQQANVNTAYAKDQTKPQIDLNLNVSENGFAGKETPLDLNPLTPLFFGQTTAINELIGRVNTLTPTLPPLVPLTPPNLPIVPYTIGGVNQAYSNMFAGRFPQYSISATVGFPLRDRTAEANYAAAVEQRRQLQVQEVALIQRIAVESRDALQAYRSARSRLIAARAAREAAEQVAASELRKFRAGQSTTFFVLQRQVDLANQRGRELQAQTDLEKALVELERVSGNILADNHVNLATLGAAPLGKTPQLAP
jgi:outer membrane protein TolC